MEFDDFFRGAQTRIAILGTNPLAPYLEKGAQYFLDLLSLNEDLYVKIVVESDSENFGQALLSKASNPKVRMQYKELSIHRNRVAGTGESDGLLNNIISISDKDISNSIVERLSIKQGNLRLPVNLIVADDEIWFCVSGASFPTIDSYVPVDKNSSLYTELMDLADLYVNPSRGGGYLSGQNEELIQMYDRQGFPRGIYPRSCFYTTEFERHSIWGFIFNRNGELLLHQRSKTTKDGRELWDKSVGGHVDLGESSTFMTAQRELVEEMFLPEAEYSKFVRADLGDILNFGEWNLRKRPEHALRAEMNSIGKADWVMFRPNDSDGEPLTITRISERRLHDAEGNVTNKKTIFRSDVYLFVAPEGFIDSKSQMDRLLGLAEEAGAAQAHKLISIDDLSSWIQELEHDGKEKETVTDDLLYVELEHTDLLAEFASFVKFLSD